MIKSREDYLYYLEADRMALGKSDYTLYEYIKSFATKELVWEFQRSLRKAEYYKNVVSKKNIFGKIIYPFVKFKFKSLSLKLGFTIPENVFGPGLAIVHYGTIVINSEVKVGSNCRIHACTNIGGSGDPPGSPVLGNNIYIGPGAKIFGAITIANNCAIAANAAVNRSVKEEGMLIGGVPAKVIKPIDVRKIIPHIG